MIRLITSDDLCPELYTISCDGYWEFNLEDCLYNGYEDHDEYGYIPSTRSRWGIYKVGIAKYQSNMRVFL